MPTTLTEGRHTAEFIVSEAGGWRSRDTLTVESGAGVVEPGTVVGARAVDDVVAVAAAPGNTGDGAAGAVTTGKDIEIGVYTLTATAANKFEVVTPAGDKLKNLTVDQAYVSTHINLTIAAGGTAFVAGDTFEVTVSAGSMKVVPLDLAADDGTARAYGITWSRVDATTADVAVTGIVRDAEVKSAELGWPDGITADQKSAALAQLADRGIIAR